MATLVSHDAGTNVSVVRLGFSHSAGLHFANTSRCNISQPVGPRGRAARCCAALPYTMKLCLGGAAAANAPYDLNASACFGVASVEASAAAGTVALRSVPMPGPAAYARWAVNPYSECALYNDAELPASPSAAELMKTAL